MIILILTILKEVCICLIIFFEQEIFFPAHELYQDVASGINEAKRKAEAQEKLLELQEALKDQVPVRITLYIVIFV
jgi:hypothetical protein